MSTLRPPPVPDGLSPQVKDYLHRLTEWAFREIDRKIPKDEATPNLILAAYDVKSNPKIFKVQVNNAGILTAVAVPFGGANPAQQ